MIKSMVSTVIAVFVCLSISLFADDLQKIDISAKMDCGSCKNKIERALKNTEGVNKVIVDMKEQNVKVEYNKGVIHRDKIVKIINDLDIKAAIKDKECKGSNPQTPCEKKCGGDKAKKCLEEKAKEKGN